MLETILWITHLIEEQKLSPDSLIPSLVQLQIHKKWLIVEILCSDEGLFDLILCCACSNVLTVWGAMSRIKNSGNVFEKGLLGLISFPPAYRQRKKHTKQNKTFVEYFL